MHQEANPSQHFTEQAFLQKKAVVLQLKYYSSD